MDIIDIVIVFEQSFAKYAAIIGVAQYFISRRENKWPGRIVIMLSAIWSIYMVAFINHGDYELKYIAFVIVSIVVFSMPTVIFYIIYRYAQRSYINMKKAKDIDKMKIMDL